MYYAQENIRNSTPVSIVVRNDVRLMFVKGRTGKIRRTLVSFAYRAPKVESRTKK